LEIENIRASQCGERRHEEKKTEQKDEELNEKYVLLIIYVAGYLISAGYRYDFIIWDRISV
jgi:hypothetical protein